MIESSERPKGHVPGWGAKIGVMDIGPMQPIAASPDVLAARAMIAETLNRMYLAIDNHLFELMPHLYTADVEAQYYYGPEERGAAVHGRDALVAWLSTSTRQQYVQRRHMISATIITTAPDLGSAVAHYYLLVDPLSVEVPPRNTTVWVRAHLRPDPDVWRIARLDVGIDRPGYTSAGQVPLKALRSDGGPGSGPGNGSADR